MSHENDPGLNTQARSTGDMRSWYTGRPCELTKHSHINFCVFDSTWEASEAYLGYRPDCCKNIL